MNVMVEASNLPYINTFPPFINEGHRRSEMFLPAFTVIIPILTHVSSKFQFFLTQDKTP